MRNAVCKLREGDAFSVTFTNALVMLCVCIYVCMCMYEYVCICMCVRARVFCAFICIGRKSLSLE